MVSSLLLLVHIAWLPLMFVAFLKLYARPHPFISALLAHFLGAIFILPALLFELAADQVLPARADPELLKLVVAVAPVEEGAKLGAAILAARLLGLSLEERSFLPVALAAALGFGAAETVLAVGVQGVDVLTVRVLVSVPAHVLFTSFAAALVIGGKARSSRWTSSLGALALACAVHIAYDAVLLVQSGTPMLGVVLWLLAWGVASAMLTLVRLRQQARATAAGTPDRRRG